VRWAVILAGGVGTRFWPLSNPTRPKQLLPLAGDASLLQDAVRRVAPMVPAERTLIVTSRALADAVRRELREVPPANVLVEPVARSTAAALAWATAHAARADADAAIIAMHADWAVADAETFREAAAAGLLLAQSEDVLVTVGARPTRVETGYGHIVPGAPLGAGRRIMRFVEKPDASAAHALMFQGALWNTGMFLWTARRFLAECDAHTPELAPGRAALASGDADAFFAAVKPVSVDVGVFERTKRGAVVTGDFGWDDVGSWAALRRVRLADDAGNVAHGDAHLLESSGCVAWSDEGPVVVYGMTDVVVVRARGITLVTTAERAPDLKRLLDRLPPALAGERGA
jgi:mannose-1-phosphate guanylyltransferase